MSIPAEALGPCAVYEGESAVRRLGELGLTVDLLRESVVEGDEARGACTIYHPTQAGGQRMWSDTTAGLRNRCIHLGTGWEIDRTNNFETTVNRDHFMAIAVMGGDEYTGYRGDKMPRVRRRRGPVTQARIRRNVVVMDPLFKMPGESNDSSEASLPPVWLLLIRAAEDWLYLELSLPTLVNESGYVVGWAERVLLPKIETTGGVTPIEIDDDDDGFSVAVVRK